MVRITAPAPFAMPWGRLASARTSLVEERTRSLGMISATEILTEVTGNRKLLSCRVAHPRLPRRLHFTCESSLPLVRQECPGDALLLSLLWPAMLLGEDLHLDCGVSEDLLFAARHDLQGLLLDYEPGLQRVGVHARPVSIGNRSLRRVATGFSAGVDSFATLCRYNGSDAPRSLNVEMLVTFNTGAMGSVTDSRGLFEKYCGRTRQFAAQSAMEWATVNTNIDDFYAFPKSGFQKTHTLRNAAAAHAIGEVMTEYLYSSSYPFADIKTNNYGMEYIDPILLPLISTQFLRMVSACAEMSRVEKIKLVSDHEPAFRLLDVCVSDPVQRAASRYPNCSRCWKCARTLLTLEALGRLENFRTVFELDTYRRNRSRAYQSVLSASLEHHPIELELIQFLSERGESPRQHPFVFGKCLALRVARRLARLARGMSPSSSQTPKR